MVAHAAWDASEGRCRSSQVTLDFTLSEKLDSNIMDIYLDGNFVQRMSRGYDVVKAMMQWARSTIVIDDFTISHA